MLGKGANLGIPKYLQPSPLKPKSKIHNPNFNELGIMEIIILGNS